MCATTNNSTVYKTHTLRYRNTHTHAHADTLTHARTHTLTHTQTLSHSHTHAHTHAHSHTHRHSHTHTNSHTPTHTHDETMCIQGKILTYTNHSLCCSRRPLHYELISIVFLFSDHIYTQWKRCGEMERGM